jgi:hypothetical protein
MVLNQDFKEFIQSLNAHNVRYLIIGGYAVAFHGHPRYTKDLDVWIELAPQNAANILKALTRVLHKSPFLPKQPIFRQGVDNAAKICQPKLRNRTEPP